MGHSKINEPYKPDSTAERVALWRALHVRLDAKPHVLNDEIGIQLINPPKDWVQRPDMHPEGTSAFRASIVIRARFIEDLVKENFNHGLDQYVILGSGLDTFAQRHTDLANQLKIFEVEKPETLFWKEKRLNDLDYEIPKGLNFIPFNFESVGSWWDEIIKAGFNSQKSAIVTSIGVSMYLTKDAIMKTLKQMTQLAPGSKFIMTFMLPLDRVDPIDQPGYERSIKGAALSGTPFVSFFLPDEMLKLAREVGFKKVEHISTSELAKEYLANRTDGLRCSTGEEILIATT